MARPVRRASPAAFLAAGLDPSGRTGRAGALALALPMLTLTALLAFGPGRVPGWGRGHEAAAVVPLALLLVPAAGHALRRLNDMGWRGWSAWLLLVPWARLGLVALLVAVPSSQRRPRPGTWRPLGLGIAGLVALGLLGSLLWTTAPVLAQGMRPALLPGDRLLLRRAPVALSRGDVVAVRLSGGGVAVARLVALPGERVALAGGVPVIDGVPAEATPDGFHTGTFGPEGPDGALPLCGNGAVGLGAACTTRQALETLPGGAAHAVLDLGDRPLDGRTEVLVPEDHLFLLGDHRDAALDSRAAPSAGGLGMVPEGDVLGRADRVLASWARAPWDPRGWRPGRTLGAVE